MQLFTIFFSRPVDADAADAIFSSSSSTAIDSQMPVPVLSTHGTFDGSRVWFAAGENLRALDPESGAELTAIDVAAVETGLAALGREDGDVLEELRGFDWVKWARSIEKIA